MIFVKDVMTRRVKTVDSKSSIVDAAKVMARLGIGALVVVKGETPTGIITEGDISRLVAKGVDPATTPVSVGKKKLVMVAPSERIEVAAKMMAEAGVKKLPVVEDGRLVGMLTQTDIVNSSFALVTSLKEMVRARYRPPDFEM